MVNVGDPMDDANVIQIMLNALPNNYGSFIQFVISQDEVSSLEKISRKLLQNSDVKIKMLKLLMMK
jgi:hypothetical protein